MPRTSTSKQFNPSAGTSAPAHAKLLYDKIKRLSAIAGDRQLTGQEVFALRESREEANHAMITYGVPLKQLSTMTAGEARTAKEQTSERERVRGVVNRIPKSLTIEHG